MRKYLLLVMVPVILFSCKSKTVSLAVNDERVNISDFLDFFQTLKTEPWGARTFIVRDPDGNLVLFAGPGS